MTCFSFGNGSSGKVPLITAVSSEEETHRKTNETPQVKKGRFFSPSGSDRAVITFLSRLPKILILSTIKVFWLSRELCSHLSFSAFHLVSGFLLFSFFVYLFFLQFQLSSPEFDAELHENQKSGRGILWQGVCFFSSVPDSFLCSDSCFYFAFW